MTYTNLYKITSLNERLREEGRKGLSPRRGKTEKDHKSGAWARNKANVAARGAWESACGGNTQNVPHPDGGKARGKRNPSPEFKAPRKTGKRKRN